MRDRHARVLAYEIAKLDRGGRVPYAGHDHDRSKPGPCPACLGQITAAAAAVPAWEVAADDDT